MQEEKYLQEIRSLIENNEASKIVREIKNNYEDLLTKWNIGKLLVEAQGEEKRAKYGSELIKKWGIILEKEFGKNYNKTNLFRYRQFYLAFPIVATLSQQLSWSQYVSLLPIKNENERNYYINQVVLNNLSVRELRKEIKNKSFDRLSYADKNNIKLIDNNNNNPLTLKDMIKDPIILEVNNNMNNLNEKAIHKLLIELVESRFMELGSSFALVGHEYPLRINNKTFKIDLLFFNIELNAYVVVEIKNEEFKPEYLGQIKFYMDYIDNNIKKENHKSTEGILIVKEKDKYVIRQIINNKVFITTFELITKNKINSL